MDKIPNAWHLAENESEKEITEFELVLWRVFHAFLVWQQDCEKSANDNILSGQELSVLHVIRMMDRSKSVSDIAKILNRRDIFNIKYSIKKLIDLKLIEKSKSAVKKDATYQLTQEGIKNTDTFVKARKELLISSFVKENSIDLEQITNGLMKIKGIYDEAARQTAAYKSASS